jgi:hypothetical protein
MKLVTTSLDTARGTWVAGCDVGQVIYGEIYAPIAMCRLDPLNFLLPFYSMPKGTVDSLPKTPR